MDKRKQNSIKGSKIAQKEAKQHKMKIETLELSTFFFRSVFFFTKKKKILETRTIQINTENPFTYYYIDFCGFCFYFLVEKWR